jgi:hypothetical protein
MVNLVDRLFDKRVYVPNEGVKLVRVVTVGQCDGELEDNIIFEYVDDSPCGHDKRGDTDSMPISMFIKCMEYEIKIPVVKG